MIIIIDILFFWYFILFITCHYCLVQLWRNMAEYHATIWWMAIFRMHPNGFETPRSPEPVPSLAQIVIQQLNTPSRQAHRPSLEGVYPRPCGHHHFGFTSRVFWCLLTCLTYVDLTNQVVPGSQLHRVPSHCPAAHASCQCADRPTSGRQHPEHAATSESRWLQAVAHRTFWW